MKRYIKLSNYLKIDEKTLEEHNICNMFIDDDTGYYIDVEQFKNLNVPEFNNYKEIYSQSILDISKLSFEEARKKYFKEPKYCHLGETLIGTKGKGLKYKATQSIIKEINSNLPYYRDINNLIRLPRVSKSIGKDAINDFLCNIYLPFFLQFTERLCDEINLNNLVAFNYNNHSYQILCYEQSEEIYPIIFYPKNLLRKYIFALTYNEVFELGYSISNKKIRKHEFWNKNVADIYNTLSDEDINTHRLKKMKKLQKRFNNIEIYDKLAIDIINDIKNDKISIDFNCIVNYIIVKMKLACERIIAYHKSINIRKDENYINSIHYKQICSFICAQINEQLIKQKQNVEIFITNEGFFIIGGNSYVRLVVRTDYNKSCVNIPKPYRKSKKIYTKENLKTYIIINDDNNNAIEYKTSITPNKNYEYIFFGLDL